ncbi:hypothetical protein DPMN_070818 [Dreissena polymorpha]|uniref:alpha-amylase n=2 Tax=Dreissena polymorpha TaxID=45954 RepID=A0A9D3Z222_DREPO|nr:hypothetical protein DPMN_070818 [Dreissena polymorpha]
MTARFAGVGTAGSAFDATNLSFPAVPYTRDDFNGKQTCKRDGFLHDYEDLSQRRNCEIGLVDLNQAHEHVRDMIVGYMNNLIDIGVAGFRIDAASHIWPGDLAVMFARLHHLKRDVFGEGKRPFIVQEVIEYGNSTSLMREYLGTGRVTRFNYSVALAEAFFRKTAPLQSLRDIGSTFPPSGDALVFVSNHDTQRWHGNGGAPITFFEPKELKMATIFMLAYSYGVPRIMSSFLFNRSISSWETENYAQGPPHGDDMSISDVIIKTDMTCGNGWVCEHRLPEMFKMVRFANVVAGTPVQNWQTFGDFQIAFSRGSKGFVAMAADDGHFNRRIRTGLPAGRYCDVISGDYVSGTCDGKIIDVDVTGSAHITFNGNSEVPVTAIHAGAML